MRIDLKNKLFYFIILGLLFIPFNVHALVIHGNNAASFSIQGTAVSFTDGIQIQNLVGFYGFKVDFNTPGSTQLNINYRVSSSGNYNISGFLFFNGGNAVDWAMPPVIMINNTVCSLGNSNNDGVTTTSSGSTTGTTNGYYTFFCQDVSVSPNTGTMNILYHGGIGGYVSVWNGMNFSKSDDSTITDIITQQEETNQKLQESIQQQQQTNDKLDEIQNSDISDSDKEMPDDSAYQDYSSTQDELLEKTKEADLDTLDVGLDVQSSSWVWDTLTRLIQSNSVVFGMIIAILSIGVIKLVLGR